jgi:uncharacterized protein (TIGR02217 family)
MAGFHEIRFPTDISLSARGGPEWRTDIVTMRSGFEQANSVWANSRRKYNAGYGVKDFQHLEQVLAFFEERRGKLHGFRWKDRLDWKSCSTALPIQPTDQTIGTGDGATKTFQLTKTYGSAFAPWQRLIRKPVASTIVIALNGISQPAGWSVDVTTGLITFAAAPPVSAIVSAGFEYDVPVRFDTDYLEFDLSYFAAGHAPSIPIVEIRV